MPHYTNPEALKYPETQRMRLAIFKAKAKFPEPVYLIVKDYIEAWIDFGYRLSNTSKIAPLIDVLLEEDNDGT